MKEVDFAVIGAGAAGEGAAHEALRRGASVAVIERELLGGSCPFWACMPSKALLHAAGIHALGGDYPWARAARFRDYIISRESGDWPDDGGHLRSLEDAGASIIRGEARMVGVGRVEARAKDGKTTEIKARNVIIAVGSYSTIPDLPGLDAIKPWTNREATSARSLPRSLAVLGGGPTGVELAQVYARYGVPVTIVHPEERLNHHDHPRNSDVLRRTLERDGVQLLLGKRAERIEGSSRVDGAHGIRLSDGSTIHGHEILFAIGRTIPLEGLGVESLGLTVENGRLTPDEFLRIAPDTYVVGDPAGPEMHTHLAHYQGEKAVHIALGDDEKPDYTAIPRAIYTDPEVAGVGLRLDQAHDLEIDAAEVSIDLAETAKGEVSESFGHATIVVDRATRTLVGAFLAGPGAADAIHLAVLAVKTRTPLDVLADTITAFPTISRALGTVFVQAHRELNE